MGEVLLSMKCLSYLLFNECDCLARIQSFRTSLGAIHDGVATVKFERVIQS